MVCVQVPDHGLGVSDIRQGAGDDDPIKAGQRPGDLIPMVLYDGVHAVSSHRSIEPLIDHRPEASRPLQGPRKRRDARAGRTPKDTGGMQSGLPGYPATTSLR
jgi:hypothetical protein